MNEVLIQPDLTRQYIETLEKTNQQLGLWSNPYGVSVMILSVWVTIIAITVAYIIYKQSADYKEKIEEDRAENKTNLASLYSQQLEILEKQRAAIDAQTKVLEEGQKRSTELDNEIKEKINSYKEELKSASNKDKIRIEKLIKELSDKRMLLNSNITVKPIALDSFSPSSTKSEGLYFNRLLKGYKKSHQCSVCGMKFIVDDNPLDMYSTVSLINKKGVKCPFCGNTDEL